MIKNQTEWREGKFHLFIDQLANFKIAYSLFNIR
jgi:hypothetical protein